MPKIENAEIQAINSEIIKGIIGDGYQITGGFENWIEEQEQAINVANKEDWKCHKCGAEGYKTDGESKVWCEKCINKEMHPQYVISKPKIGRNEPCSCGSGKKYKKCCALVNNPTT